MCPAGLGSALGPAGSWRGTGRSPARPVPKIPHGHRLLSSPHASRPLHPPHTGKPLWTPFLDTNQLWSSQLRPFSLKSWVPTCPVHTPLLPLVQGLHSTTFVLRPSARTSHQWDRVCAATLPREMGHVHLCSWPFWVCGQWLASASQGL